MTRIRFIISILLIFCWEELEWMSSEFTPNAHEVDQWSIHEHLIYLYYILYNIFILYVIYYIFILFIFFRWRQTAAPPAGEDTPLRPGGTEEEEPRRSSAGQTRLQQVKGQRVMSSFWDLTGQRSSGDVITGFLLVCCCGCSGFHSYRLGFSSVFTQPVTGLRVL